ncbi:RnfABCDGE type electron transport complex subunit B [Guggenheimella bovis]
MDFNSLIGPIASMAGLGVVFGSALAYASQKFAVPVDERAVEINAILPQANCGGCGFPGCMNYAQAVVEGAEMNRCSVGGAPVAVKIAGIMGAEANFDSVRMAAKVLCHGGTNAVDLVSYSGIKTCSAMNLVSGGPKACKQGCLGCGDCVKVCQFGAIKINDIGVAEVDPEACTACKKCIEACPKKIIMLIPADQNTVVTCSSLDPGAVAKKSCEVGCIGCKLCEKACRFDAIHVENNLARIDYTKCTDCMECFKACPTHAITADESQKKKAEIDESKCIGCTICAKNCPEEAISGELKAVHKVDQEKCIGCGVCEEKCPKQAITLK